MTQSGRSKALLFFLAVAVHKQGELIPASVLRICCMYDIWWLTFHSQNIVLRSGLPLISTGGCNARRGREATAPHDRGAQVFGD